MNDSEKITKALDVCSTWVTEGGQVRKNCLECPYRDEDDPAGMNCGETLMRDARELILGMRK